MIGHSLPWAYIWNPEKKIFYAKFCVCRQCKFGGTKTHLKSRFCAILTNNYATFCGCRYSPPEGVAQDMASRLMNPAAVPRPYYHAFVPRTGTCLCPPYRHMPLSPVQALTCLYAPLSAPLDHIYCHYWVVSQVMPTIKIT